MPSAVALRSIVGITLGLGSLDLALVTLVLGPQVVHEEPVAVIAIAAPHVSVAGSATATPAPVIVEPAMPIDDRVHFATDSARLDTAARAAIAELATRIGDRQVTLEGHADVRGPEALNLALSKQRAEAVAAALTRSGIDRTRIVILFAGARDATGRELWRDRRVDIHVGDRPR
jgi:outer membrane protein OmpA-like peptidoglycan-associated protein